MSSNLAIKLQNISKPVIIIAAILLVAAIGIIDAITGKEISFSILYLIPATFVTWYADKRSGIFIAALSVGVWLLADAYTGVVYSNVFIHLWNGLSRFGIYLIIIYLETYIKERTRLLEHNVLEKTADLSIEKIKHKRTYESVKRLSLFPELNPNPIIEIDSDKQLTYCNKAADDFIYDLDLAADYSVFLPADIDEIIKNLSDESKLSEYRELHIGEKVIEEYIYLIHSYRVIQIYAADITNRKIAEGNIKNSLKEKELLLKEIHHRVKNNLQIISSLLRLQSSFIKDKNDLSVFIESQNRISSIASIHKMLYESADIANIDAGEFFKQLIERLFHVYNTGTDKVKIEIETGDLKIDTDLANPIGLLITEIVSNSLKYAFPGNMPGRIFAVMKKDGEKNYLFEIGDTGIGMANNIELNSSPTLGLQLIDLLAKQFNSSYNYKVDGGTKYVFEFEKN